MTNINLEMPRKLNAFGLGVYTQYFDNPDSRRQDAKPPVHLLNDPIYSEPLPNAYQVPRECPATKLGIGKAIDRAFGHDFATYSDMPGVFEWLTLLWSDRLVPATTTRKGDVHKIKELARYAPVENPGKRFRHNVWGPAVLYNRYGDLARCLLISPSESLQYPLDKFVFSRGAPISMLQALDLLFVKADGTMLEGSERAPARQINGAPAARLGSIGDALQVFYQLAHNYCVARMSPEKLCTMLSDAEFGPAKRNAVERLAKGIDAPATPLLEDEEVRLSA